MLGRTVGAEVEIRPLSLRAVGKHFERKVVLQSIDLDLERGEVLGLLGPNGAGKTTLLSIAAGLVHPDRGDRLLAGRPAPAFEVEQRAHLAYVSHAAQLYPLLSARENLELFADLRRVAGFETAPLPEILAEVGLGAVIDEPVSTYSRGMMQRLCLGRALMGRPQILLLDEPFTALDREGRTMLSVLLRRIAAEGTAIFLSSHDVDALVHTTHRILVLEGGRLVGEVKRPSVELAEESPAEYRARLAAISTGLEVGRA